VPGHIVIRVLKTNLKVEIEGGKFDCESVEWIEVDSSEREAENLEGSLKLSFEFNFNQTSS
jgi:hypothetical protein